MCHSPTHPAGKAHSPHARDRQLWFTTARDGVVSTQP
jgi:hypothetical protein